MKIALPRAGRCDLAFALYGDGTVALLALSPSGIAAKITVCLDALTGVPKIDKARQVWIKTWAENEGFAQALAAAGVATPSGPVYEVNRFGSLAVLADLSDAALAELRAARYSPG